MMPNLVLLLAAGASLCFCILLVFTARWHGRYSMDHVIGVQKFHTEPTPRIGGIAIFGGLLAASLYNLPAQNEILRPLLVACLPAFAFGLIEDFTKRVGVAVRLAATMFSGGLACLLTGVALNRADVPILDQMLAYWPVAVLFTAFAVAGIANAVNIIDGFNGLSSGTALIILAALASIALKHNDKFLAWNCIVVGAAVAGFWIVNFPLGKLFLGDGGAYLVGFSIAWLSVLLLVRNPSISPWLVLLASGYPVIEVLYSMFRRFRVRRSAGAPDSLHLHSILKIRVIRPRLRNWPPHLRNSAVSPFMWLFAALPAGLAIVLAHRPVWLVISAFVGTVCVYHFVYQLLLKLPDGAPASDDSIMSR